MKYYNDSSVGVLITRAVTDMERIADIFGQGLFMIFSDILKMLVVAIVMLSMNVKVEPYCFYNLADYFVCYKNISEVYEESF